MFRKLLFFILLAGIGFGIYTGINKAMDAFHTPKIGPSPILSGTVTAKTGALSSIGLITGSTTKNIITTNQPGFFGRIWIKIKGLFASETVQNSGVVLSGTEDLFSGVDITGVDLMSGASISGDILSGDILSGNTSSGVSFEELTTNEETGQTEIVTKTGTNNTPIQKSTTTIKKPTTTKAIIKNTTTEKDPILNALFK